MATILEQIKTKLEVDLDEPIFDPQLLSSINAGIAYLRNNNIPLKNIDESTEKTNLIESDELVVLEWLSLYTLQRFDRSLMQVSGNATNLWIDKEMQNLLYQLKVRYANMTNRDVNVFSKINERLDNIEGQLDNNIDFEDIKVDKNEVNEN